MKISDSFRVNFCYLLFAFLVFLHFLFPVCFFASVQLIICTEYQFDRVWRQDSQEKDNDAQTIVTKKVLTSVKLPLDEYADSIASVASDGLF